MLAYGREVHPVNTGQNQIKPGQQPQGNRSVTPGRRRRSNAKPNRHAKTDPKSAIAGDQDPTTYLYDIPADARNKAPYKSAEKDFISN